MKTPRKQTSRTQALSREDLLQHYACEAVQFSGDANASYERHVVFDHVVEPEAPACASVSRRWRGPCATCWCRAG